jgi:NADPH-dependent glutamate synthase beta subunit-like oxidoreductase/ferredoxin
MIRLTVDNQVIEVLDGKTILQAARDLGIEIPTMCFLEGTQEHPSCMVCLVKDTVTGKLLPACGTRVSEGMTIVTDDPDVNKLRQESLELLLSDHVGDCEAPCRLTCPAFMNIPLMNRLIAAGKFSEALDVVREEIAIPFILGYICPAPCEKACKRKQIDEPISICLLKRFSADDPGRLNALQTAQVKSGKRIAILGTGPAGLSAAYYLLRMGHECVLFDKQEEAGGALRYSIPEAELPREVLDAEINAIRSMGGILILNTLTSVNKLRENGFGKFDAFILATGNQELHPMEDTFVHLESRTHFIHKDTLQTSMPDAFACGSVVRELNMAVRAGAQGKLAAINVNRFLMGETPQPFPSRFNSVVGLLEKSEYAEYLKESAGFARIEPSLEFPGGYTAEEAMAEAARCMHCDCRKINSCLLRKHSDSYNVDRKRFAGNFRKQIVKNIQHELVVFEPEKCIKCGICIRITSSNQDIPGLTYIGRGFDVHLAAPFHYSTGEALSLLAEDCANHCPTGALAIRNQEDTIRNF